ncbi:MAG: 4Fe-4S dicluster domain-containing protein [PVC group bacterium]
MKSKTDSLVDKVWQAGVVGAGGAGFPTWKKIDARVETVIVNGAECEPLLRNDQQVMAARADEVVRGLTLVMGATGAARGVIALKKKYTAAIAALEKEMTGRNDLGLHLMESVYPAGDEFVIVYEVTGEVIPPGEIPLQAGILVSNVETFCNISRAQRGKPVISRYLTVTGAVREPKTLRLPIGTPLETAVELAGGAAIGDWVIVTGGPMMGEVAPDPGGPVTKTTSAVIVLPAGHPVVTRKTSSLEFDLRKIQAICCQCDYCTLVCPRSLLGHNFKPHIVMRSIAMGLPFPESPGVTSAPLCCNCDLCGVYSCPMNLPIGRLNKQIAGRMKDWNWDRVPPLEEYVPSPQREYSLIPVSRLTSRLRLGEYDRPAPLVESDFQPETVTIPLKQHIGQPAEPVVKEKQRVTAGDVIGDLPRGTMGARVHASISGVVKKVTNESVTILAS